MATELQPGDPGWTLVPATPAPAPAPTPAPVGPLPGEKGFDLSKVPIAPVLVSVPAPVSQKQAQFQADLAKANQSVSDVQQYGNNIDRMKRSGLPMVQGMNPQAAQALVDASKDVSPSSNIVFMQPPAAAPLIAPTVVPAHEVSLVSPKRQAAEEKAIAGENQAVAGEQTAEKELGEARAGLADARAEGASKVADAARNANLGTQARGFANKEEAEAYRKKIDEFSNALAEDRIDPNGMWNNASVPRQITWTLARAFGAIQQGLLHLPSNQIADQIDAMARADVEAQKASHAIKRGRLEDMKSFYDYAIKEGKDASEADRLAHGFALETARSEAAALGEAAQSPIAKAEAMKVVSALDEKIAQNMTRSVQRGMVENKWVPAGISGAGASKPVESKTVFYDPITNGRYAARDEVSRKKLAESGAMSMEMKAAAKDYREALEKVTDWDRVQFKLGIITPRMAKAQTSYQHTISIPRHAQNDGVWKKSEQEMLENLLQPPQQFTGDAAAQLAQLDRQVDDVHRANMKVEDPTPVVSAAQPVGMTPRNIPTGQTYVAPKAQAAPETYGFTPAGARAEGGKVERQPYLVGEKGPELLLPNKPEVVLSALQTAADRGAPPTRQQMSTLSDSVRRFAEKAGVLKRADGGAVKPSPPTMTPEDEEEMRKFFGDKPTEKFAPPTAEDKRLADEENRRGEELQKQAIADAQRRNAEAQRAAAEEEYYRDRPVERWARRAASALAPSPEVRAGREQAFGETLANVRRRVNDFTGQYVPDDLRVTLAQAPVGLGYRPEHDSRISTRQPVSISRGEMSAVPIGDADGEQLRMSPEGRAYYTAPEAEHESRIPAASLSGASRAPVASAPSTAAAPARARKLTPAELLAQADAAIARTERDERNALAAGPAVRRLAPGTPENGYTTELTTGAEPAYESWRQRTSPYDTGRDYDLRGAFAEGLDRDPRGHLPDTYKKPNHDTFSDESMYARYAPEEAGSWSGETYRPKGPPAWLRQAQAEEDAPPTSIADVLRPR